jgi:hypothetical protein
LARRLRAHFFITISITGCAGPSTPPVNNFVLELIATCNAGYLISTEAELSAKISQSVSKGLALQTAARQELRGLLLSSSAVTEENVESIYRGYLSCVKNERSLEELLTVLEQRHEIVNGQLLEYGLKDDAREFDTAFIRYIDALKKNQRVASHESLSLIYRILAAAHANIHHRTGVFVNFVFSKEEKNSHDRLARGALEENQKKAIDSCVASLQAAAIDTDNLIDKQQNCTSAYEWRTLEIQLDPCNKIQTAEDIDRCFSRGSSDD